MRKIGLKILGIVVVLIMILQTIAMAATNETVEKNNDKIDELKEQKGDVQEEKSSTQQEVDSLNTQISDYQSQINDLDTKINNLNTQIEEAQKKLEEAQVKYDENKKLAEERLVVMQESGDTTYLDIMLSSSDNIVDMISGFYLASELAEADTELLDGLEEERQEVENAKAELENSKTELANSKTQKESVSAQLEVARNEKSQKVTELSSEEQDIQEEIDQLEKDNQQILNEIKIAQEKYKAQLDALKNQANSSNSNSNSGGSTGGSSGQNGATTGGTTTGSGSGIFIVPLRSYSYISTNGYYSSGKFHGAIDYAVNSGTPVYAAADGVVMTTKDMTTSYGTYVVIQHANGLQTWYGHGTRGSISVSPGQTVKQGQQIMLSGSTGNSSGPHLHFEVRRSPYNYSYSAKKYGDDSRVNPNNYF